MLVFSCLRSLQIRRVKPGVHTRDCTCLRPDWTVASQSGRRRPCSVHCPDYITTRSTPSDSLNAADVYAPWCHLVFRHASVMTAVVIGCYLKSGDSRFSWGICWNVSRPGRNTVASDAWPSFKARRRWIGAKSLVCTPGFMCTRVTYRACAIASSLHVHRRPGGHFGLPT